MHEQPSGEPPAHGAPRTVMPPLASRSPAPAPEDHSLPAPVSGPPKSVKFRPPRRSKLKLLLGLVIILLLLGAASAAAYYTVLLPNQPEALWHTAMDNTAKGYDGLIDYSQKHVNDKGGELSGTYSFDGAVKTDGALQASWYDGTGTAKLDVGVGTGRATLEGRLFKSASQNPDVYVNVTGIKGLATQYNQPNLEPTLTQLDGQWIAIDHTMFDNLEKQLTQGQATQPLTLTPQDSLDIGRKTGEALKAYVFTDDPARAVFTIQQKVGREEHDGRSTYHYKAGVHKQHLKDFAAALKDKLNQTKLKDLLGGKSLEQVIEYDQLIKEIDKIDTNTATADVWIDTQTKLFQAVRIYNKPGDTNNYVEFGVPYTGGDDMPFVLKLAGKDQGSEDEATVRLTLNTKTNQSKLAVSASNKGKQTTTFKLDLSSKIRTEPVRVDKPTNAKPLAEVMSTLGLSPQALERATGSLQSLPLREQ